MLVMTLKKKKNLFFSDKGTNSDKIITNEKDKLSSEKRSIAGVMITVLLTY